MYWLFGSFPSRSSTLEMMLVPVLIEDMILIMRIAAEAATMAYEIVGHLFQDVAILASAIVVVLLSWCCGARWVEIHKAGAFAPSLQFRAARAARV
jgi:hypothetical protein